LCVGVLCCVVLCLGCFGGPFWSSYLSHLTGGSVKSARFASEKNLLLTWNGKRAFTFLRFFPYLLVFSHLFSLLPASSGRAGGPAGRLFTFLPVSSLFFASLLASPRLCGRAGGTTFDVSSRLFSFFRLCTIWSRWIYISVCKCMIFVRNTELLLLLLG
jgi:hypothetical protein